MIMSMKKFIIIVCLLFPFIYGTAYSVETGGTGLNFLKLGVGPRAIGMGEAFVAVSDDASAFYWNPSGLSQLNRWEVSGMLVQWLGGMSFGFLSGVMPVKKSGAFGLSITSLSKNDIAGYGNDGASIGNIGVSDTAIALTYAHKVTLDREKGRTFHLGVNVKYIGETLHESQAVVFALDAGVLYKLSGEKFNIGFSMQNLGTELNHSSAGYPLPLNYRLGFSSRLLGDDLLVALDFNLPNDNRISMNVGCEYRISNLFALRAGYKIKPAQYDLDEGLRCGMGFISDIVDVDYAYTPYGFLGEAHRFSLSYRFGNRFERGLIFEKIDKYFLRGKKYYGRKDYVRANKLFNNVLVLDPNHEDAKKYLGMIASTVKDIKVELYLEKGRRYLEENKLLESKEEFENILSLFPGHPQAEDYIEKLKDRIVTEKQKMADIMFDDGLEYYRKKQYKDAIELWKKVLLIKPGHKESRDFIVAAEAKQEETRKAEEIEILAREYSQADVLYKKGLKQYEKQDYDKAVKTLESTVKLNPKHESAVGLLKKAKKELSDEYFSKGKELFDVGNFDESIEKLKHAVKLNPGNSRAAESLKQICGSRADEINKEALLKYSDGKIDEAIELWEEVLRLFPDHVSSRKNLIRAKEERDKK